MPRIQRGDHELERFELRADLDNLDRRSRFKILWAILAHQTEARGYTEKLRLARTIAVGIVVVFVVGMVYLTGDAGPAISVIKELLANVK